MNRLVRCPPFRVSECPNTLKRGHPPPRFDSRSQGAIPGSWRLPRHLPDHSTLEPPQRRSERRLPLLVLGLLLSAVTTLACRYNVRDVGFVDLETDSYHLYGFIRPETPPDTVSLLRRLPATALRDCNVQVEIVNVDASTNHPALKHLSRGFADSLPTAVLVSPDGQALPLTLSRPGQSFQDSLASALGEVAASVKREEILRTVCQAFAGVLLIEGDRADENERARHVISRAIDAIGTQMRSMPKAVAEPPAMIVLDAAALLEERILLWSLGLEATRSALPRAVVLYGRARWIGPVMKGEEISEPNLTGLLSIIGADCECGLDVAWTLGTRLPVRWEEARHAQVARALAFDPESPLVKLEVSRIARRSTPPRAPSSSYQEPGSSADRTPSAGGAPAVGSSNLKDGSGDTPPGGPAGEPMPLLGSASVLSRTLSSLAALAAISVSAGLFLFWRAGRRRPK